MAKSGSVIEGVQKDVVGSYQKYYVIFKILNFPRR